MCMHMCMRVKERVQEGQNDPQRPRQNEEQRNKGERMVRGGGSRTGRESRARTCLSLLCSVPASSTESRGLAWPTAGAGRGAGVGIGRRTPDCPGATHLVLQLSLAGAQAVLGRAGLQAHMEMNFPATGPSSGQACSPAALDTLGLDTEAVSSAWF